MKKKSAHYQVQLDSSTTDGKAGNGAEEILLKDAKKDNHQKTEKSLPQIHQDGTILLDGEELVIQGYRRSAIRLILSWMLITISFGLVGLVFHWYRQYYLFCTHFQCSLEDADTVLITETYKEKTKRYFIKKVDVLTAQSGRCKPKSTGELPLPQDDVSSDYVGQPEVDGSFSDVAAIRYFDVKKCRFIWNADEKNFVTLNGLDAKLPLSYYHGRQEGLNATEQWKRRILYGTNFIRVPVDSYLKLFALEFTGPFYMFQIFSIFIWIVIEYYYFSAAIVIMAGMGLAVSIHQTKKNQSRLRDTIQNVDFIEVRQSDGIFRRVGTESLVPGDIIAIPSSGCTMHCDAILLKGTAIVNESTLTGESVPLLKTPLPNQSDVFFLEKEHNRHTLYGGTRVIQARYFEREKVLAFVIRTGYSTTKGKLVSSILYPIPVDFRFEQDSYKFIGILALVSVFGIVFNLVRLLQMGERGWKVFGHTFDIVTITVPPALPAAMTVGSYYAAKRLKKKSIICINPRSINVAGSMDLVCFDKTGTLTEDGMDFWGVLPGDSGHFVCEMKEAKQLLTAIKPLPGSRRPPLLLEGMATCHSLTFIEGQLCGDPLELKVFEASGWMYEELRDDEANNYDMMVSSVVKFPLAEIPYPVEDERKEDLMQDLLTDHVVGVVKNFPFSSSLQRSSVVTKVLSQPSFDFFCKGSPEMIKQLCSPNSVPSNFSECLSHYTQQGLRVIAMAHRKVTGSILKIERMQREDLEVDLFFLGFIVLENRLKSDTAEVLQVLANAGIKTLMITGDNLDTAISVGRECGMICHHEKVIEVRMIHSDNGPDQIAFVETSRALQRNGSKEGDELFLLMPDEDEKLRYHLAIDGNTLEAVRRKNPEVLPRIYARGTIFARMKPDQKQMIVVGLQDLGHTVGMCGDGANDCGALKAAHAGISLTETEASVASSFTSKNASIACVPELIKECRCALITSFGIFKYMAAYSLTQFVSVMILYDIGTNLTDLQFLYIDLFLVTLSSAVFGLTEPYAGPLTHKFPPTSLMSVGPVASIFAQIALVIGTIFASLSAIRAQDWFVPYDQKYNLTEAGFLESPMACYEGYAVFAPTQFIYIFLPLTFCKGFPFRKRFYTNVPFTLALLASAFLSVYIALYPFDWLKEQLELELPESFNFRLLVLGLAFGYVIISLLVETYLVDLISKVSAMCKFGGNKSKFKEVSAEMDLDLKWEPNASTKRVQNRCAEVELQPLP